MGGLPWGHHALMMGLGGDSQMTSMADAVWLALLSGRPKVRGSRSRFRQGWLLLESLPKALLSAPAAEGNPWSADPSPYPGHQLAALDAPRQTLTSS